MARDTEMSRKNASHSLEKTAVTNESYRYGIIALNALHYSKNQPFHSAGQISWKTPIN